jgi:hypothetical protein
MITTDPDRMLIRATRFGPAMTARQSIQRAKKIMQDIEAISPWRRPFDVNGCTRETSHMPIAADLSDFDEVVMRALQSYDNTRYYSENDPENRKLTLDSVSPYGFTETFSNAPSAESYESRVSISIHSASVRDRVCRDDALYLIEIPCYAHGQANASWSEPDVVWRLFSYFISNYNPQRGVVYGNDQSNRIPAKDKDDNYTIGWLNYTKDPKVAGVFTKTGKAVPYRAGVLLKLGDDASVLSDPKIDAELAEIGEMLWSAGVRR